jgi:hypothetical protein
MIDSMVTSAIGFILLVGLLFHAARTAEPNLAKTCLIASFAPLCILVAYADQLDARPSLRLCFAIAILQVALIRFGPILSNLLGSRMEDDQIGENTSRD